MDFTESMGRLVPFLVVVGLLVGACTTATPPPDGDARAEPAPAPAGDEPIAVPPAEVRDFGQPPDIPSGPVDADVVDAVEIVFGSGLTTGIVGPDQRAALEEISATADPRLAWLIADLMRFVRDPATVEALADAAGELLALDLSGFGAWGEMTDHLIAWDVPAPPGYLGYKRNIFSRVVPQWSDLMVPGAVDWRLVSWGGVGIDDRPPGRTDDLCNCIPAADDPPVETASEAAWLSDDAVVFGVVVGGESRAYPRRIMEVREMVNDSLGGRDFAMPYCTLCGSAQVFLTDELPDPWQRPILRTSGLLSRSNKVMYDLHTNTVFDTFTGAAVAGPLAEAGVVLPQATVVTTTWGEWKAAHPDTTVLVEELALGRDFDFRNGRDADGPIFPIGDADDRLPLQADVVGVITDDGPVAFWVDGAKDRLRRGEPVEMGGVRLVEDGGGLRAFATDGAEIPAHQAFWFAWSQFHPGTALWVP